MVTTGIVTVFAVTAGVSFPGATCDFGAGPLPCGELSVGARALTFTLLVVGAALFLKVLHHISRLFKNYARGEIFTRESVRQIRSVGMTVLILGTFQIAALAATVVLMGMDQIVWPAHRPIPLPFAAFVSGALIMLVSWVMELGTDIREENELTV
jgi:hypothetical protein